MFKYTPITAAFAVALMSSTAVAADKGGNFGCCADLEERVAELEATAARKDNRKVSVTVYGQVNWALLSVSADGFDEQTITNNSNNTTKFGFKGSAKIRPGASAGYLVEIGLGEPSKDGDGVVDDGLVIRHSALYLQHDQFGTFWLGKTSTATDGIAEISIPNVNNASTLLSLEPVSGAWLGGVNLPFDGGRKEVVKWVSPNVGGFTASAAWIANDDEAWDAALRYAGEGAGFKFAAGVGYRSEMDGDLETISGSASIMHMASGVFMNGAAGKVEGAVPFIGVDPNSYHVQAGIERNFFGPGATTLYGEWARFEAQGIDHVDMWGGGLNQSITAAAMDLYVGYRHYEELDADTVVAGAIIRF